MDYLDQNTDSFVHPAHLRAFTEAARANNCHILVRETGLPSISWIGREGYTGKRADVKAKTAKKSVGAWQIAGLVCSPEIHPGAFPDLGKAMKYWKETSHLVTVPENGVGFDDRMHLRVKTPYVLQNNRGHRHYGCIAWAEMGLMTPRYIHGDYDLYAIIPAGQPFCPAVPAMTARAGLAGSLVKPAMMVKDLTGPLSFSVATFINNQIAAISGGYAGALMVNHGEQLNLGGKDALTNERVLAFFAQPRNGQVMKILADSRDHAEFYRSA